MPRMYHIQTSMYFFCIKHLPFAGNEKVLVLATASGDKKVKLWAAPSWTTSAPYATADN